MNVAVRMTEYGLAVHRDLANPRAPLVGIEGSMLWSFDGTRLRLIWFGTAYTAPGQVVKSRPFKTYAEVKRRRAAYMRVQREEQCT